MASKVYRDNYALIDFSKDLAPARRSHPQPKRSGLGFPMVISDTMPEAEHVDGKFYTSKRAFRAVTKAHGYVEVGDEKQKPFKRPEPNKAEIRESLRRAKAKLS